MSANKLGREVKKVFGLTSEPIAAGEPGKTVRVYKGLRFLMGEAVEDASTSQR